jgi:hypothetical protein
MRSPDPADPALNRAMNIRLVPIWGRASAEQFGLSSHERTTTAMARDVPISREDYLLAMSAYAEHRGSPAPESMACVLGTLMVDPGLS